MIKQKFYVMDRGKVSGVRQPHDYVPVEQVWEFASFKEANSFLNENKNFNLIILQEVKAEQESVPNRLI